MRKLILLSFLMLAGIGCSTFQKQWREQASAPADYRDISGLWEGTWKSDASSHTDKLRSIITPKGGSEYEAFFRAKYKKIFTFSYKMSLQTKPGSKPVRFEGEADLGKLAGGKYTYNGFASPTNFFCTYSAKYDHGTFELKRPSLK